MKKYHSWGLYPKLSASQVRKINWRNETDIFYDNSKVLPFGLGRSYGDVCLVQNGTLIDTSGLNHFIFFDKDRGLLKCESGVSLAKILKLIVRFGWFLPVTPGTKFVTIGGAIANDVHGKNHHNAGSFGHYVKNFELLRSDGDVLLCSNNNHTEFFKATIGGLGLTGLILSAEIALKKIPSEYLNLEYLKFNSLDEFFEINTSSERHYEYTVAWVDVTNGGENTVRGIYQRANHIDAGFEQRYKETLLGIPFALPFSLINKFSTSVFNYIYYGKQFNKIESKLVHYDAFFYPLDAIGNWNYLYGRKGFLQYQFVIPREDAKRTLHSIFNEFKKANLGSFLTVLKTFGNFEPPGYLSFPRDGVTVAIDFPINQSLFNVLDKTDEMVVEFGGALYPAKDARMKPFVFRKSFQNLETFLKYKDPKFNSAFWERVF